MTSFNFHSMIQLSLIHLVRLHYLMNFWYSYSTLCSDRGLLLYVILAVAIACWSLSSASCSRCNLCKLKLAFVFLQSVLRQFIWCLISLGRLLVFLLYFGINFWIALRIVSFKIDLISIKVIIFVKRLFKKYTSQGNYLSQSHTHKGDWKL